MSDIVERLRASVEYSHNFATAKPDIGKTEFEHIAGLCALATEAAARVAELEAERAALRDGIGRCFRMLLSEPDTKGALFKAENILRAMLSAAPQPPSRPCKYGDPTCPCQDGDSCHYEGENPWTPPAAEGEG